MTVLVLSALAAVVEQPPLELLVDPKVAFVVLVDVVTMVSGLFRRRRRRQRSCFRETAAEADLLSGLHGTT